MKKVLLAALTSLMLILVVCGSSKSEKQNKAESQTPVEKQQAGKIAETAPALTDNDIEWSKFDEGLTIAAEDGKYAMVFFWRHG